MSVLVILCKSLYFAVAGYKGLTLTSTLISYVSAVVSHFHRGIFIILSLPFLIKIGADDTNPPSREWSREIPGGRWWSYLALTWMSLLRKWWFLAPIKIGWGIVKSQQRWWTSPLYLSNWHPPCRLTSKSITRRNPADLELRQPPTEPGLGYGATLWKFTIIWSMGTFYTCHVWPNQKTHPRMSATSVITRSTWPLEVMNFFYVSTSQRSVFLFFAGSVIGGSSSAGNNGL